MKTTPRFNTVKQADSFARALRRRALVHWKVSRRGNDVEITFPPDQRSYVDRAIRDAELSTAVLPVMQF